ncbi:MAG: threonine--tRNA ligase [Candidatus Diapherotrites archaeon]|nr:threonine--tRNA ligase [Candidatus Diapherotrites archaeon]
MKLIALHSDFIEFEPKKKAVKSAEETEKAKKRVEDCLVVFTSIEKGDEAGLESVVAQAVDSVKDIAAQVKAKKVVVYPWVHLTSNPSSLDAARQALSMFQKALSKEFECILAPFGFYKKFNISVKGHPLAELSREITPTSTKAMKFDAAKALHSISKAVLSKSELKENDHRIIGQNLDLFSFYNVAPGMVFWHPKGLVIYNELIKFWREEHRSAGYQEISTPEIMSDVLWKVSGHWEHYKDHIFITEYDKRPFVVRPMNCPGGLLVYKSRARSYKELPMRVGELGTVHRVELSGVLSGLFRVVKFMQDDAHIYCTGEQLEDELAGVLDLTERIYAPFGFKCEVELSTRPKKAMGEKKMWDRAEAALESVLKKKKVKYKLNEGEGAFYGPKIDFHVKDSLGRSWQLGTLQLDFQMPERFNLTYIGEDGKEHTPIMLHRALYGSFERFIGVLLEHLNGNLPPWLAPVQVKVISFSEKNDKASQKLGGQLFGLGYRVEVDTSSGTVQAKVRDAELQKIPYIIVIGDKEEKSKTLAVRTHGAKKAEFGIKFEDFEKRLRQKVESRELKP